MVTEGKRGRRTVAQIEADLRASLEAEYRAKLSNREAEILLNYPFQEFKGALQPVPVQVQKQETTLASQITATVVRCITLATQFTSTHPRGAGSRFAGEIVPSHWVRTNRRLPGGNVSVLDVLKRDFPTLEPESALQVAIDSGKVKAYGYVDANGVSHPHASIALDDGSQPTSGRKAAKPAVEY